MEVSPGWTHAVFPLDEASRVGEARRHAAELARALDWDEDDAGRLALVVTELGTNLLRHASHGRLLIAARPASADVEVIAIDDGPGIGDLSRAMQDGVSSGGTPGTGLGAVKRLANDFDMVSSVPQGTLCVARVRHGRAAPAAQAQARVQVGAVCVAAPKEQQCGDGWATGVADGRALVLLADGLGHGPEAAHASGAAVQVLAEHPAGDPRELLQRCHVALQTTRGAAVCIAAWDLDAATVQYAGAGNISGRIVSGVFDKSIATQHGTVGAQIRRPELASAAVPEHALLLLHSDGLETRWKPELIRPLLQRDPTLVAAALWRAHTRHRDDVAVIVLRRKD